MRWTIKPKPKQEDIDTLASVLKVDDLVAQLLLQRGISTYDEAKKFFRPQLSDLHDPFLMKDMDVAVYRIEEAIIFPIGMMKGMECLLRELILQRIMGFR